MRGAIHRLILIWLLSVPVSAMPALSFTGGNFVGLPNATLGWAFSLSSAVTVTSLGVFDRASDGLVNSHQVGIWSNAGTLLTSATVQAGVADPLVGGFRYNSTLAGSVNLAPGSYVIGAHFPASADSFVNQVATVTTAPPVTFVEQRGAGGFNFPNATFAGLGAFGPNFQFSPAVAASVPEIDLDKAALPLVVCLLLLLLAGDVRRPRHSGIENTAVSRGTPCRAN